MPQKPYMQLRQRLPAGTVDKTLQRAFALILTEDLPLRLRMTLDMLRQKGPDHDHRPENDLSR